MPLSLEKPSKLLLPSFLEFASEMEAAGETLWDGYYPLSNESADSFISRQLRRETDPEPSLVPETVYWGVSEGHVIGRISLRHRIEGRLLVMGGHIGYEVRPSHRRRGFAREMLRLLLRTPKAKSIGHLLLTCSPDNIGSNKTIISNGGVLSKTIYVSPEYGHKNHYWIEIGARSLQFSRARPEHAEALSALAFASKSHWDYSEEYLKAAKPLLQITEDFIRSNEVWIAAADDNQQSILGFFALCLESDGVLLDHFWVTPKQIGNGVGRKMFQQVIAVAARHRWSRIFLYSDPNAEAFYSKMGARRIGERPSRVPCGPIFPVMEYTIPGLNSVSIAGQHIRLRDYRLEDLASYAKWREPGHAWQEFDGPYYRIDPQKTQERIALRKEVIETGAFPNPRTYLVIADSATDELVGEVNCYWKSIETYWMCLGIDIFDSSKWGKGIGFEALTLWTQYLLDSHPKMVRLGLETWSGNHGMIKLALKLGYQEEARIRKARIVNGEYFDSLAFGILRDEWETRRFKGLS